MTLLPASVFLSSFLATFSAKPAHAAVLRMFVGNPGDPLDKFILP